MGSSRNIPACILVTLGIVGAVKCEFDSDDSDAAFYCNVVECYGIRVAWSLVIGVVGAVTVSVGCYLLGFGCKGIVAGSWAAWFQANYGVNWLFSFLQSAGAKGGLLISAVGFIAGLVIFWVWIAISAEDCYYE